LNLAATVLQSSLGVPGTAASRDLALRQLLLVGGDTIDARFRLNDAIVGETLRGFAGNDTIYGGLGNDTLFGEDGADSLYGGGGNDILIDSEAPGGGAGRSDYLNGGVGDDRIVSGAGNDTIDGGTGRDVIKAGLGDDYIIGGPDPDIIVYEGLWSELSVAYIPDQYYFRVAGREGVDKMFSAQRIGTDDGTYLYEDATGAWRKESGLSGTEQLYPGGGVAGTANNDLIVIAPANATGSVVRGHGGADTIKGGELAWGGAGNDRIISPWRAFGEDGNDTISGAAYAHGGDGIDRISGSSRADTLFGDVGNDDITGGNGNDAIDGGVGNDTRLAGEGGNDMICGGDGHDVIDGGAGNDTLNGGYGNDTFSFKPGSGSDAILDFTDDVDTLRIDSAFGLSTVAQILAMASAAGNDARIVLPGGATIILTGYLAHNAIADLADDILIG
jgi:Ca2+-binding RTX toxin-like protein